MNRQTLSSILKLFAISANKHNDSDTTSIIQKFKSFLDETIENAYINEYIAEFKKALDEYASFSNKRLSLNSVRLIRICNETSQNLSHDDRIQVLFYLEKLLFPANEQSEEFMRLVADIYEIDAKILTDIENLHTENPTNGHQISEHDNVQGVFILLSNNLAAIKSLGNKISINGNILANGSIELIGNESVVRIGDNKKYYLKDIVAIASEKNESNSFSLILNNISIIRRSKTYFHALSCEMHSGELVGIMGRSGSGKTTLLKAIAGIEKSHTGNIFKRSADGDSQFTKAYLPQANALIPLFTVKEHLEQRLDFLLERTDRNEKIKHALESVELEDFANNIAAKSNGTPWQISGGQQKRLGIAMEMLANPEVFILDEPTSGLSSTDSQKIVTLLRQIASEQKIVIASIHQPDFETFMMFDKILIIDDGGYPIFYGKPSESAEYFRRLTGRIDKESLLETHFNPGVILNIINETTHDNQRITSPEEWYRKFVENNSTSPTPTSIKPLNKHKSSGLKSFVSQLKFSFKCDLRNKIRTAMIIGIPPLMAVAMSLLTRFSHSDEYAYYSNPNIPAWLMMLLITAFFLGLVVSAHEFIFLRQFHRNEHIIKDKSTSLSLAKITKYIIHSGIMALLLTLPATLIEGNMFFFGKLFVINWLLTFCGSLTSMIISLFFRSISTVYLLIPIIVIPQMIFSGGLVQYDNFNQKFVKDSGMPLFANLMPIRWADEACMTEAYLINPVEQEIFEAKVSLYETAEKIENTTDQAHIAKFRKQKNDAQAEIDSKLACIENSDSIYRRYGNMYISKIVTTLKSSNIPPIYDTETSNEAKFLCGRKMLAGKIISTYSYNVMILVIMNFILAMLLVSMNRITKKQ
ncbi:MAG: ATP-binding cassette domain-containing protein [Bacteroidales bacterium]|nr:ATP-binding cassette domain-containing protein [Bacteroidales bacterium]